MAKRSGIDFALSFGGTAITANILSCNGVELENTMDDGKPFGVAWATPLPTGDKSVSDLDIEGMYDDAGGTASTLLLAAWAAITTPASAASATVVTWGSTKTSTGSTYVAKFARTAARNAITKFKATLKWTGAIVEA